EGRAAARLRSRADIAAVRAHDGGDDREPEADPAARPRSRRIGAVEALEDPLELIRGQARPVVLHLDHCAIALPPDANARGCTRLRVRANVREEVVDDLPQPVAVAA